MISLQCNYLKHLTQYHDSSHISSSKVRRQYFVVEHTTAKQNLTGWSCSDEDAAVAAVNFIGLVRTIIVTITPERSL